MELCYYYQILDMGIVYEKGGLRGKLWKPKEQKRLREELLFWRVCHTFCGLKFAWKVVVIGGFMSKVDVSFSVSWDTVKGVLLNDGVQVSSCEVFCGGSYMSIIRWNTVKDCQRMGFGSDLLRCTLRHCVNLYGKPERMYYEWDKVNQYVMDWLVRIFGAEHQSYEIYTLDVDKVLEFVC